MWDGRQAGGWGAEPGMDDIVVEETRKGNYIYHVSSAHYIDMEVPRLLNRGRGGKREGGLLCRAQPLQQLHVTMPRRYFQDHPSAPRKGTRPTPVPPAKDTFGVFSIRMCWAICVFSRLPPFSHRYMTTRTLLERQRQIPTSARNC
jgi:hypothetical protein